MPFIRRSLIWSDPRVKPPFGSVEIQEQFRPWLTAALLLQTPLYTDTWTRRLYTPINAPTFQAGARGTELRFASDTASRLDTGLATSTFLNAGSWTLVVYGAPNNTSASVGAVYEGAPWVCDGGQFCGIHHCTIGATDAIWAYNWDGAEKRVSTTYTVGRYYVIAAEFDGTNLSLYKDGAFQGSVASGNTQTVTNLLRWGTQSGSLNTRANIVASYLFNRALGPGLNFEIGTNFYGAVLRPIIRRRYVVPVAPPAAVGWGPLLSGRRNRAVLA
jgi:hypothetical protein